MSKIHIKRAHNLSREEARARVESIAKDLKKKLDANYAWQGDSLKFKRSGASGSIDVTEKAIDINIELGMMLSPMKGKIEKSIKEHVQVALADSKGTKLT